MARRQHLPHRVRNAILMYAGAAGTASMRVRRPAITALLLLASARAAPGQLPYSVTWWDAASVSAAGGLALLPVALNLPKGAPSCAPCDPASLPGIDHAALHTFSGSAGTASHVLLAAVVGGAGFASLHDLTPAQARGNVAVLLNSLAWTEAATGWLKVAVHRNRPILYTAGAAGVASDRDNRKSSLPGTPRSRSRPRRRTSSWPVASTCRTACATPS